MKRAHESRQPRSNPPHLLFACAVALTVAVSLAAALFFDRAFTHQSLYALSNLVGPTTHSLLSGGGLTVCTTDMGTPANPICFHAGRMPIPSLVVAVGIRIFGNHFLPVALFKTLLFLIPVELSLLLVLLRLPLERWRQIVITLLLLAPFAVMPFLANVVNLQVEEAYAYSLLALAVALLFFDTGPTGVFRIVLFAALIDALYLSKSSMAPAALVLSASFLLRQRSIAHRLLLITLVALAPCGWALHQHHASGRYTLGTSLDGINLHKANVSSFLDHYPPPPGSSLDQYDADLNRGLSFPDEWSFNDFHQHAAIDYIRTHPRRTLEGDLRKLDVLLVSVKKYGSSESRGWQLYVETAGLLLFRIILWASIGGSVVALFAPSGDRRRSAAAIYLALVAACVLPYLVGFAFTRHASILVYPASLMCCRLLAMNPPRTLGRRQSDDQRSRS